MGSQQTKEGKMNLTEAEKTLIANAHLASVETVTGRRPLYEAVASIKQKGVEDVLDSFREVYRMIDMGTFEMPDAHALHRMTPEQLGGEIPDECYTEYDKGWAAACQEVKESLDEWLLSQEQKDIQEQSHE